MGLADRIIVGLFLVCLAVVIAVMLLPHRGEEKEWLQFRREHHCRIVGEMTGGYKTPPKTGWLCDDGKTYWR